MQSNKANPLQSKCLRDKKGKRTAEKKQNKKKNPNVKCLSENMYKFFRHLSSNVTLAAL